MLVSKVPCPMCSQLVTLLLELALCRLLVQTALMLFSKSLDLVSSVRQMVFYKRSYHAVFSFRCNYDVANAVFFSSSVVMILIILTTFLLI